MDLRCFGIKLCDELPVVLWVEVLLALDNDDLVSPDGLLQLGDIFVCASVSVCRECNHLIIDGTQLKQCGDHCLRQ